MPRQRVLLASVVTMVTVPKVEKLKAHERNILQLLQRNEAEEAMSRVSWVRGRVVESGKLETRAVVRVDGLWLCTPMA